MRRATMRNSVLAVSGTLAYLGAIVVFNLGCPGGDSSTATEHVDQVTVSPSATSIVVGTTTQFQATTVGSHGDVLTGRTVTWSSGNAAVASVSTGGLVSGVAPGGPVTITATSEGTSGSAQITVTAVPVATVTVSGGGSVRVYEMLRLTATTKDANGNILVGRDVTWSSSAPNLATVSGSGDVTGVATGGPVTITATSEGQSGSASVTVTPPAVDNVTVLPGAPSVPVGGTVTLTATLRDVNDNILTGRVITWSSDNPGIATVSASGVVTGVSAAGSATITATSEGISGSARVTVTPSANPVILVGRVIDYTTQTGIVGAAVQFLDGANSQNLLGGTTTGAGGDFTSQSLIAGGGGVMIDARATGYVPGRVLVASVPPGGTTYTEPVPLVPLSSSPGGISGTVRNARTGLGIPAAEVNLYNNFTAGLVALTTADANGFFTFSGLSAGTYRLAGYTIAPGYTTAYRVGVAVGNNSVTAGQDIVLSPTGTNDIRIVLTWGATPSDIDSHLTGPNADATRFHVYYSSRGNLTSAPFAFLDIDDVSSFGPETITITQFNSGNYRYSVHDYSNRSSSTSTALGSSGAKVEVYTSTGLVQTFFVPNQPGTLWTVFEMTGTIANPVITPRNQMSLENDPSTILSPPADGSPKGTDAALISRAAQQHPKAKPR
jgi:uncharacterized protein YjdB